MARMANIDNRSKLLWCAALLALVIAAVIVLKHEYREDAASPDTATSEPQARIGKVSPDVVMVSSEQAEALDIGPVKDHAFRNERPAIGLIDFDQDRSVQVFTAYQGRIAQVMVKAGDDVAAGQVLYTVDVPDIATAASSLISTSATLKASTETLKRARVLAADSSIPQKELLQNEADQQTADAAYQAARKSLRLYGLTDAEIAQIERSHDVRLQMPVRSPIAGRVTARSAQAGLLVQPGVAPAPVTVADVKTLWMVASIPEADFGLYKIGQAVQVKVQAWPDKTFTGRISYIADSVDPATRRLQVRAEVKDPNHELRAQMSAEFEVVLSAPITSPSVPAAAVVRESNGTSSVWVAQAPESQGRPLKRQVVTLGQSQDGLVQITEGLEPGAQVARRNALFLSNLYEAGAQ